MTEPNKKDPKSLDAIVDLSKITPNLKGKKRRDKILFAGLVILCLSYLVYSFMPAPKKTQSKNAFGEMNKSLTLTENLDALSRMREEGEQRQSRYEHLGRPPKLRNHHLQTDTEITKELKARMNAPTSFDNGGGENETAQSSHINSKNSQTLIENNANSKFLNAAMEVTTVKAKQIPHPEFTIPEDEMIPATLEVAINSELPGFIKAVVSRDIYSLTGSNLLIPRGSSISGQFNSSVVEGQSRILTVWNRIRRPDGVVIALNSPGTDQIGRSGMSADFVDRHFLERFGTSVLLSILSGATATAGVKPQDELNSASFYRSSIASSLAQSSSDMLMQNLNIKTVISINQGAEINVFVAHDLDFSAVGAVHLQQTGSLWGSLWK